MVDGRCLHSGGHACDFGEWSAAALGQFNMPAIGVGFKTGLFIVITDAPNLTVFYR